MAFHHISVTNEIGEIGYDVWIVSIVPIPCSHSLDKPLTKKCEIEGQSSAFETTAVCAHHPVEYTSTAVGKAKSNPVIAGFCVAKLPMMHDATPQTIAIVTGKFRVMQFCYVFIEPCCILFTLRPPLVLGSLK